MQGHQQFGRIFICYLFIFPPACLQDPASITLSLPVMRAARHAVVAATGASKAPAIRTALETQVRGACTHTTCGAWQGLGLLLTCA